MSAVAESKASVGDVESAKDIEKDSDIHLLNDAVHTFSWQSISVKVPDRDTKGEKIILSNISGNVKAGTFNFSFFNTFIRLTLYRRGAGCSNGPIGMW